MPLIGSASAPGNKATENTWRALLTAAQDHTKVRSPQASALKNNHTHDLVFHLRERLLRHPGPKDLFKVLEWS